MCGNMHVDPPGFRRVTRKAIHFKRLHAFAAMRWADAKTPARMTFWRDVMEICVHEVSEIEPIARWRRRA